MDWTSVLGALALGLVLLITTLFTGFKEVITVWFKKFTQNVSKTTYVRELERLASFLHAFEDIQKIVGIDRCLIFRGHNCGGLPTAGKPYTVRAIHGWVNKPGKEEPIQQYDFDLQVDSHYIKLLEDMIRNGCTTQVVSELPENCKIKLYYVAEAVTYSELHFLGVIDAELIFLSAASYGDVFQDKTRNGLIVQVDRMRSLMGDSNE